MHGGERAGAARHGAITNSKADLARPGAGCEFVEGSDQLLRFELDAETWQAPDLSGNPRSYGEPADLVGRKVVFIANLAPRKMRFGLSEGMILSAGFDGGSLALLDADATAQPGMPVR